MDDLLESQTEKVQEALDMGEHETGWGLNQELGAPDTRWGLQYKNFKNFISIFGSIIDVLDTIIVDAWTLEERAKAKGYLITLAKRWLQKLREEDWDSLSDKVSAFCVKFNILIPNFDDLYVNSIIDCQVQELNAPFNEVTTNLLIRVDCLNPIHSFSSFDINKILRMVELYPDDFDEYLTVALKNHIETYIVDVHDVDERFSNLQGLVDLSENTS
ncbi:uncharacterized protein LOC142169536 [Nicotiana tabacum]|uniref:Uncharacterized protein LOC142169536 n=1 Tax=Nicotiana tabacum TaxID=4097 RepID=A0AC58SRA9_TOBAC